MNLYGYAGSGPIGSRDESGFTPDDRLWYDRLSLKVGKLTETAKDFYIDRLGVWSTPLNSGIDFLAGFGHLPAAVGHLGEGFGAFAGNPNNVDNQIAFWDDIGTTCNLGLAGMGAAGEIPIGGTYLLKTKEHAIVVRTGQSGFLLLRKMQHRLTYQGLQFEVDKVSLSRAARLGREQIISDRYRPILNKRNPISTSNPSRRHMMRLGGRL